MCLSPCLGELSEGEGYSFLSLYPWSGMWQAGHKCWLNWSKNGMKKVYKDQCQTEDKGSQGGMGAGKGSHR